MTTKQQLLSEIEAIEGICKVETDQHDIDNMLAVTSIIQLHYGIEITDANAVNKIGAMVVFSMKNN